MQKLNFKQTQIVLVTVFMENLVVLCIVKVQQAKDSKFNELNNACNMTILGYFTALVNGIEYSFSNDSEAQDNFKDGLWALEGNHATTVKWTAYDVNGDVIRLDLDLVNLNNVNMARLTHKNDQVAKLRDTLEPQLNLATTIDEVKAIMW